MTAPRSANARCERRWTVSRLRLIPPVVELEPNQRQVFVAAAEPPPPLWDAIQLGGDIASDFSLHVDGAQNATGANGAHKLNSGIGFVEFTIDDQCRPIAAGGPGRFTVALFIFDTSGFLYQYILNIDPTSIEVRDEGNNQIYTEAYSTVSGDAYRLEGSSGSARLFRNGILKHTRTSFGTTIIYPIIWTSTLTEPIASGAARIPPPRLVGDWQLMGSAAIEGGHDGVVTFTAPSHGSLTVTTRVMSTEYFGGTIPGTYTLACQIEAASDPNQVQRATATIIIKALRLLGPNAVTLLASSKTRFKTNYSDALIAWSVVSGGGSFSQGEYTAPALAGNALVRATASVNSQAADIAITIPAEISNANGYTAAKASEQIDFDHNVSVFPTFLSAGSLASGTGDVVPGLPPGTRLNDILLLFVESANEAVSTPSGYTAVADSPQGTGTAGDAAATRLSVFWKRATATETAPTVTDPGDHAVAQILAFRGCVDSGNPWDVTSGDVQASAQTGVSIPGDTTTVANCLVVLAVSNATDTATAQTSGYTNTDLANLTERTDRNSTQGNGGGFAVITGEKAAAGAYGATTATLATSSTQGRMSIALKPAAITWTASAGSINSSSGLWTAPSQTGQTAKITVTNGTFTEILEIDVLDVFPFEPSSPWKWQRRKTVLVSTAEDRTRSSRVKGEAFEAWDNTVLNMEVAEAETLADFWDAHHPGLPFIFEDNLRNVRKVIYSDSDLSFEANSDCSINASFRWLER